MLSLIQLNPAIAHTACNELPDIMKEVIGPILCNML